MSCVNSRCKLWSMMHILQYAFKKYAIRENRFTGNCKNWGTILIFFLLMLIGSCVCVWDAHSSIPNVISGTHHVSTLNESLWVLVSGDRIINFTFQYWSTLLWLVWIQFYIRLFSYLYPVMIQIHFTVTFFSEFVYRVKCIIRGKEAIMLSNW